MEWPVSAAANPEAEIAGSRDPLLRMFTVTRKVAATPQRDVAGGRWEAAAPATTGRFSAVGYAFARALRKALGVPVGVLHTSWGGTRIEAWTSREALTAMGTPAAEFDRLSETSPEYRRLKQRYDRQLAAWKAAGSPAGPFPDPGMAETAKGWAAPDLPEAGWTGVRVPGAWEASGAADLEFLDGAVWFRRNVDVPANLAGKPLTLSLGAMDDHDTTFFNGVRVGATGAETANPWQAPRRYAVPGSLVKAGSNVIAVRVWDLTGGGGMTGPAGEMYLEERLPEGVQTVAAPWRARLDGEWQYRIETGRVSNPGSAPRIV
jgi:sialate O-acetylesterase